MANLQGLKQGIRVLFIRPSTQPFFEALHTFSIRMMNYGNALYENTGEVVAFKKVATDYAKKHQSSSDKFIALDVGGNKGNYAKACIEEIKKIPSLSNSFKWYSFEPAPGTFEKCTDTLKPYPEAEVVQIALNDSIGNSKFRVANSEFLGTNGLIADAEELSNEAKAVEVSTTTLDQFLKDKGISHVDFLKIDAEGFDLNVLKGATRSIKDRKIDAIQFEYGYSPNSHFLKEYYDFVAPYFDLYRILPTGLRKVKAYSLELEVPHGINYLCLRKQ